MKIVVTGFEAFLAHDENPTEAILKKLPKEMHGFQIIPCLLPVAFEDSFNHLSNMVDNVNPDIVIMLGLAGGRKAISLERIAINIDHSKHPDNNGVTKHHETINENGNIAYFSTLPIEDIMKRLESDKIPCEISNSAGTYVCNNIFYQMMSLIDQRSTNMIAGFVHVPYMKEQSKKHGDFSLELSVLVKAIEHIINACIERK